MLARRSRYKVATLAAPIHHPFHPVLALAQRGDAAGLQEGLAPEVLNSISRSICGARPFGITIQPTRQPVIGPGLRKAVDGEHRILGPAISRKDSATGRSDQPFIDLVGDDGDPRFRAKSSRVRRWASGMIQPVGLPGEAR